MLVDIISTSIRVPNVMKKPQPASISHFDPKEKALEMKMRDTLDNLTEFSIQKSYDCNLDCFEILSIENYKIFNLKKPVEDATAAKTEKNLIRLYSTEDKNES